MKHKQQIKIKAIQIIENVITLTYNVRNGCASDKAALEIESKRLPEIKIWAEENNMLQDIKHYFSCTNFGFDMGIIRTQVVSFLYN